ncbi:MAG: EI24 domain-containing protein [Fimbriimonadales bacterium]|nr:EI24 domain-containing protein [Fimbriimonadales bacterium]
MQEFVRGNLLILKTPRLWSFVWKPMAIALACYVAIVATVSLWLIPYLVGMFDLPVWIEESMKWLGRAGLVIVMSFLGLPIYLAISGLFSSLLWDRLSLEVERTLYGTSPNVKVGCGGLIWDSLTRAAFSGVLFLVSLCFFWTGPIAPAIYAAWIGTLDFSASAYIRRGVLFPSEFSRVWKPKRAKGFAIACGLVSLVPLLFVLMLPGMVAGATILCREGEKA